jgi:ATP-dependent helicase HepA
VASAVFVVSGLAPDWGIGKLLAHGGGTAQVEYFQHPGPGGRSIKTFPVGSVRRRQLELQSRVFYQGAGRWNSAFVTDVREDAVEVSVGTRKYLVPYRDLFVLCDQPLSSPAPFLVAGLTEDRTVSILRSKFMKEAILQRSSSAGIEGLVSASVELHPHQINVVRRVLSDPVQRYLLADEVGLGKTVEAAAIIRQHVIDDPAGHRIAVVVPEPLVHQWRSELTHRFHLGPPFLDDSLRVLHAGDEELFDALKGVSLIVVDEAHTLVGRTLEARHSATRLAQLREACQRSKSLLLLSATPAIADEDNFFELMRLIDPEVYTTAEREAFGQRIAYRQELAQIIAGFEAESMGLLVEDGERLRDMFPSDNRLAELLDELTPIAQVAVDPSQPELQGAVAAVRRHLAETYRLHRRILRNRRAKVRDLTPPRNGAQLATFSDPVAGHVARELENWRLDMLDAQPADPALSAVYAEWIRLLLEAPDELASAVHHRFVFVQSTSGEAIEIPRLRRLLQHLDAWSPLRARIDALIQVLNEYWSSTSKFVIFCCEGSAADRCYEAIRVHRGNAVARHQSTLADDLDAVPEWTRFQTSSECRVLVCDSLAEEGLNLQGGDKILIHFDLPIAPNRIEQRMGRIDRFGNGNPVFSVVLNCAECDLEQAWLLCVVNGFAIMQRSIASLQYLVDKQMRSLRDSLVTLGLDAITNLTSKLGGPEGEISRELRRIDQQDRLEELQDDQNLDFDQLEDVDSDWRRVKHAVEPWITNGLRFQRSENQKDSAQALDPTVRYRYNRGTLLPAGTFRSGFLSAIDTEAARANPANPVTFPYGYRRQSSVHRGSRLMRTGDAIFSSLLRLAQQCDRGRVDAAWRRAPISSNGEAGVELYFRCDMILEADLRPALDLFPEESQAVRHALGRRLDMALTPEYVTVWVDIGLQTVDPDFVSRWLDLPDDQDRDLGPRDLHALRQLLGDNIMLGWDDLVPSIELAACDALLANVDRAQRCAAAAKQLRDRNDAHLARLESRLATLSGREYLLESGRLAFERALCTALNMGIQHPRIQLDAIGAVFLSSHGFPAGI